MMDGSKVLYKPLDIVWTKKHHNNIWDIMKSIDIETINKSGLVFAGGTLCALRYGEYRESVDIDFFTNIENQKNFSLFQQNIINGNNGNILLQNQNSKYGINIIRYERNFLQLLIKNNHKNNPNEDAKDVKVEFVCSEVPLVGKTLFKGVLSLSPIASIACKLIAYKIRGKELSSQKKDLIDLLILKHHESTLCFNNGMSIAQKFYGSGSSIEQTLYKEALQIVESPENFFAICDKHLIDDNTKKTLLSELKEIIDNKTNTIQHPDVFLR